MNNTMLTVVGNVATEPQMRVTSSGARVTNFRLAVTERRMDKKLNTWRDYNTMFYAVSCWRTAAENVADSLQKGQPVIVCGRLSESTYEDKEGQPRSTLEIDAVTVGHDLTRGVAAFTKASAAQREETFTLATQAGAGGGGASDWGLGGVPVEAGESADPVDASSAA